MPTQIKLGVDKIIGTGDPFDRISLIPLIADWGVPRNCIWNMQEGQKCDETLSRLYVLREKMQGHKIVGVCENHHQELSR